MGNLSTLPFSYTIRALETPKLILFMFILPDLDIIHELVGSAAIPARQYPAATIRTNNFFIFFPPMSLVKILLF